MKFFTITSIFFLLFTFIEAIPITQRFRRRFSGLSRARWISLSSGSRSKHACFPATARVKVSNNNNIRIEQLKVGDQVETGLNRSSTVYTFTHAESQGLYSFVSMQTNVGTLTASPGHFVYTNTGKLIAARNVNIGETLLHSTAGVVIVQRIKIVQSRGLFNPQTLDSRLVVQGFVVSTYTDSLVETVAHPLLAPLRATFSLIGFDLSRGLIANHGVLRSVLLGLLDLSK